MAIGPREIVTQALVVALAATFGTPGWAQERVGWELVESRGTAMARVALPDTGSWPSQIELWCRKGMKPEEITLSVSFRIPRKTSGLPADMTTMERRLGPQCRGRLTTFSGPSGPGKVVFHAAGAIVAVDTDVDIGFVQSDEPVARRSEPPCEVATHALDPIHARLTANSTAQTRVVPVVALLESADAGEIVVEVGGREERQRFPLTGAATTIAAAKRVCGLP